MRAGGLRAGARGVCAARCAASAAARARRRRGAVRSRDGRRASARCSSPGPNTGGKTVLLKAVGLISALAQSGIPAPVGAESRIPIFDDCFADIGDEQSIEASLSTFSAHLRNLGEILASATAESLVLIDELGSGTDPAEGAALGGAILDALTARGSVHDRDDASGRAQAARDGECGRRERIAAVRLRGARAHVPADQGHSRPLVRVEHRAPARASRGCSRARGVEACRRGERDVAALLGDLQAREARLAEREEKVEFDASRAAARLERIEERDLALREAERSLERRAREDARRLLLEGRGEIERTVRELREQGAASTARDARRRVEELAATHAEEIERIDREDRPVRRAPAATGGAMAVGDTVEMETLEGRTGQIVELRNDQAIVAVGALKMTVPVSTLSTCFAARPSARRRARRRTRRSPDVDVSTEIDVRGMRVDEMELAVQRALDAAIGADLHVMRIIHGKGTGALRERVDELLRADRRVREHRAGRVERGRHRRDDRGARLMITDESVERVREGADIVQIIGEHVKLKRVGNSYRGPCPFHQGTGPNFSVVPGEEAVSLLRVPRVRRRVHVSAEAARDGVPRRDPLRRAPLGDRDRGGAAPRRRARSAPAALGRERDGRGLVPHAAVGREHG